MPPPTTPATTQQPNPRKRPVSERVLPAIPLALSKPRPSKPVPKQEGDVRYESSTDSTNEEQPSVPENFLEKGDLNNGKTLVEAASLPAEVSIEDAVKLPTADTPGSNGNTAMAEPNDATSEHPSTGSTRRYTPPQPQEAPISASPTSARKPTERFDMRHIRTELPPAFIPSAEQHTPKSAASSQSNRRSSYLPRSHPTHPSASRIVFGAQDSSTSSPAPPQSAGSAFIPPQYATYGTQQASGLPHRHAHHMSEPHPLHVYEPSYGHQPWNARQSYRAPMPQPPYFHPHGDMPARQPPREPYTPTEPQQANGVDSRSRSNSQASSGRQRAAQTLQSPLSPDFAIDNHKTMFAEPKAAFPGHSHPRQQHFNSHVPPPPFANLDTVPSLENVEMLTTHLTTQFANGSFADCQLQITEGHTGAEQSIPAHKIILSRSPLLLSLIPDNSAESSANHLPEVQIVLTGRFIRINTFIETLRCLYGGALLRLDHHRPGSSSGDMPSNSERMETALQTIATGAWLKLHPTAARGLDVTVGLLHWDTIGDALGFALDGGLSHIWSVDDGSEDRASTSSSDDSLSRQETVGAPTYDPYATHLLHRIIDFTVHVFPTNFYLDAAAPQLASCPRLPALIFSHESRPSRSDPRLSQIRFGEIPIDEHQRPSFTTTTISSVLLSIPFAILKCVLEHFDLTSRLGPETVASIMRQVVAERETRRNKALKSRGAGQIDVSTDSQLVQNLFWEEFVESSAQHRAGFRLARRRRDIDTPPSSGACSERNK